MNRNYWFLSGLEIWHDAWSEIMYLRTGGGFYERLSTEQQWNIFFLAKEGENSGLNLSPEQEIDLLLLLRKAFDRVEDPRLSQRLHPEN